MEDQPTSPNLNFSEFQSLDLNQWMERIQLDLKGKNWADYIWEIEPGLTMDPAQFDQSTSYVPLFSIREYSWIGHDVEVIDDLEAANKALLDLLLLGISAPKLIISESLTKEDWEILLHNVSLEYIKVQLQFKNLEISKNSLNSLVKAELKIDHKLLDGSVEVGSIENGMSLIEIFQPLFQKMRFLPISSSSILEVENLSEILLKANQAIQLGLKNNSSEQSTFDNFIFQISIGNSFLLEIAKLRAMRLLLNLFADVYGLKSGSVRLQVVAKNDAFCGEAELDVIRMTAMTLAANLGGADQIMLPNLDNDRKPFLQRITANIQHLLNLESNLGKVGDPLAGSHYLEVLTDQIAQKAWLKFQTKA